MNVKYNCSCTSDLLGFSNLYMRKAISHKFAKLPDFQTLGSAVLHVLFVPIPYFRTHIGSKCISPPALGILSPASFFNMRYKYSNITTDLAAQTN